MFDREEVVNFLSLPIWKDPDRTETRPGVISVPIAVSPKFEARDIRQTGKMNLCEENAKQSKIL
jgi:hypothetical protein